MSAAPAGRACAVERHRDAGALRDIADDLPRRRFIDGQRGTPGKVAPFPQAPDALRRPSHQPYAVDSGHVVMTGDPGGPVRLLLAGA